MARAPEWYVVVPCLPKSDVFGPFDSRDEALRFRDQRFPEIGRVVDTYQPRPPRAA